jgi:hypothetical protein
MLAEWSVECAPEDPVLVVPWKYPDGSCAFIDLRANPYDFDHIPEAEQYPPLMQALRALNATRSPVFTVKCDVWPLDADGVAALLHNLDTDHVDASTGFASYIDMVARDRRLFTSFHQQEQLLRRFTRLAAALEQHSIAAVECVIRPAVVDFGAPQQGYAISLYVKAAGIDPPSAMQEWSHAINAVVALIRGKDFLR